jgi:hypothetical protein
MPWAVVVAVSIVGWKATGCYRQQQHGKQKEMTYVMLDRVHGRRLFMHLTTL